MPQPLHIQQELDTLAKADMLRGLTAMPDSGPVFMKDGQEVLNFSSNDYLNLSHHPDVTERSIQAVRTWGTGATASRLLAGNLALHEELEQRIAEHKGKESALLFGNGYLTNCGILSSFLDKDSILIADKLIHACILDGARFAGARIQRFRHNDMDHLEHLLKKHQGSPMMIAVESVYSMNGDLAPLAQVVSLAKTYDALLLVDEAHSYGIHGPAGCGRVRELGLEQDVDFSMGTLSKTLASYGGYVACSRLHRDWMINRARSLIYSTALPPASVGAALGALEVIAKTATLGTDLLELASWFRDEARQRGLAVQDTQTQIIPIQVGSISHTVSIASTLRAQGIWIFAIRPPTVPEADTCLRFSLSTGHSREHCTQALDQLQKVCDGVTHG